MHNFPILYNLFSLPTVVILLAYSINNDSLLIHRYANLSSHVSTYGFIITFPLKYIHVYTGIYNFIPP